MRVGITGQAGFVGTHLFNMLGLEKDVERIAFADEFFDDENVLRKLIALTDVLADKEVSGAVRNKLNSVFAEMPAEAPVQELIALNDLQDEQSGIIAYVSTALKGSKKFADMGLVPGARIILEGRAPLGDLLRIRLLDSVISLRGSDAAYILLKDVQ